MNVLIMLLIPLLSALIVALLTALSEWSFERHYCQCPGRKDTWLPMRCRIHAHDWEKWSEGECNCPRCKRIRVMERELLGRREP